MVLSAIWFALERKSEVKDASPSFITHGRGSMSDTLPMEAPSSRAAAGALGIFVVPRRARDLQSLGLQSKGLGTNFRHVILGHMLPAIPALLPGRATTVAAGSTDKSRRQPLTRFVTWSSRSEQRARGTTTNREPNSGSDRFDHCILVGTRIYS